MTETEQKNEMKPVIFLDDYDVYKFPNEPTYWLCNKDGEGMGVDVFHFDRMVSKGLNIVLDQFFRSNH